MIGNLILALGVAICCGAPLVKDTPHRLVNYNTVSNVTGEEVYCFNSYSFDFRITDGNKMYSCELPLDSSEVSFVPYNYGDAELNPSISTLGNNTNFANISHNVEWYNNELGDNGALLCCVDDNWVICRFYFPFSNPTKNIEFQISDIGNWGAYALGDFHVDLYSSLTDNFYLLGDSMSVQSTSSVVLNNYDNYLTRFNQFYFAIRRNNDVVGFHAQIFLYGEMNLNYQNGYNTGYGEGYSNGLQTGYQNGYAEGLSAGSGANANLLNLFGVVADTPIRFLKQMFSFELFGMNVAVVILSCLTAVIIFGIVKKVWK